MNVETETLKLDRSASVPSIREQLSTIRGRRVLLILPEDGVLFRRKLDLVLIQRECYRRAIQLAIISRDPKVVANAGDLNISCFPSIDSSQHQRWKRGRQKVFLPRYHKPTLDPQPEELRSIASRLGDRNRRQSWIRQLVERAVILALLIGTIGAAVLIVAPSATVVVTLSQEQIATEAQISADVSVQDVDFDKAAIPAQLVTVVAETTATVPTTGIRSLDDAPATGIVTITNRSEEPVIVPAFTTVSTSAGEPILFRTMQEITVPAGIDNSVEAPFEALRRFSGVSGNVAAGMINTIADPLADSLSVINLAPAAGGEARSVRIVDSADRELLVNRARSQLLTVAYEKIKAGLSDSQLIVIDSLAVVEEHKDWTTLSAQVGDIANELTTTMRAHVAAVIVDESLSRKLLASRLRADVPAGAALLSESLRYSRGPIDWNGARKRATFTARLTAMVVSQVDSAALRERLAGLSLEEARLLLESTANLAGESATQIEVFPAASNRMPSLPIRINLDVRLPE